jgi:hypothetical protein
MIPAAAATLAGNVRAALLVPGDTAGNFLSSLAERPDLHGAVIASEAIPLLLRAGDGSAIHSLTILNQVIRSSYDNTLSFSYRLINDSDSGGAILGLDRLDTNSFAGFNADVASVIDERGQTSPSLALRGSDGAQITFDFDDAASRIAEGASSFDFLVKTNATEFNHGGGLELLAFTAAGLEEGSDPVAQGAASAAAFQPSSIGAAIPLPPATLAVLPTTIAVTLYTLRRQRRARAG